MATTHSVGGEIDAFCGKCKMTLAHTILAMVGAKVARVRCNTCGADHAFRGASAPSPTPRSRAKPAGEKAEKVILTFQDRLAGRDLAQARSYSPKDTYKADEVISHPTFGYGIVSGVRIDKIDVDFKGMEKTLLHGRGQPAAHPRFDPPKTIARGPADKPFVEGANPPPQDAAPAPEPEPLPEPEQSQG